MLAAYSNSGVVDKDLKEELESNRLVEVQSPLAEVIHTSKLGVIPRREMAIDSGSVVSQVS